MACSSIDVLAGSFAANPHTSYLPSVFCCCSTVSWLDDGGVDMGCSKSLSVLDLAAVVVVKHRKASGIKYHSRIKAIGAQLALTGIPR
jgi:hypothetical protein